MSKPMLHVHPALRRSASLIVEAAIAMDRALGDIEPVSAATVAAREKLNRHGLAFDRASVRTTSQDGHLHVSTTHISKAGVNPYLGSEIPNYEELGLVPDKIYRLYRDPDELARSAESFNGKPLLFKHKPMAADDHQHDIVIGSTGTGCTYNHPYLDNSIVIWTRDGIEAVETEEMKELSSAYRYRADMTPGEADGVKYDGVMRDISGNHVSIVKKGRAGSDVVVGDSALKPTTLKEMFPMSKKLMLSLRGAAALGALMTTLKPVMAQDAKIDLAPLMKGVTTKNFSAKKASIVAGVKKGIEGKLAQDGEVDIAAVVEAVSDVLDAVGGVDMAESVEPMEEVTRDDGLPAKVKTFLEGKISDEDMAELVKMMGSSEPDAMDSKDDDKDADGKKKEMPPAFAKDMVTKPAMDQAIKSAVTTATENLTKAFKAKENALIVVRPYVGDLMGMDTAEDVFKHALTTLGVKGVDDLHPSALQAVLEAQPLPNARKTTHAMDSATPVKDFTSRYPGSEKVGVA